MTIDDQIRLLADRFVGWQTPYGRPDPNKCPLVATGMRVMPSNFHSPIAMAIGLYSASAALEEPRYEAAADRYVTYYFACLRNPRTPQQGIDFYLSEWLQFMEETYGDISEWRLWANTVRSILSPPFMYGMALAGYRYFRRHHPDELALDTKAAALYEWLQEYRWRETSWFRCSYGSWRHGVVDVAFADDLCHVGRGLVGYYEISRRPEVLTDAIGLAQYYLNEMEVGAYRGCWSSALGTWAAGPNEIDSFEHFTGIRACDIAFVETANAIMEFLVELAEQANSPSLKKRIAERCVPSLRWIFDACQFEDGAVGIAGRDDACLGSAGAAVMAYLRCRQAGFLDEETAGEYGPRAVAARDWMLRELTPAGLDQGGYFTRTGKSFPKPEDNLAWFLGLALEALPQAAALEG